jgi:hypothetical protein
LDFFFFFQSSYAEIDFLTKLIFTLLKLTCLTKPLSTTLKLAFMTTPPINPPTLLQLVSELFSSCSLKNILLNLVKAAPDVETDIYARRLRRQHKNLH